MQKFIKEFISEMEIKIWVWMCEKSKEQDIFYLFRLNLRDITSWSISSNNLKKNNNP